MADDCIFCKISSGAIKADVVFEGDRVIGFRDNNPMAPTHILIIPKEHIRDVTELESGQGKLLAEIFMAANELARSEGIVESGFRIVANVGPNAGQTIFHLHVHLLGGRGMAWPPG